MAILYHKIIMGILLEARFFVFLALIGALAGCAEGQGIRYVSLRGGASEPGEMAQRCQSARSSETYDLRMGRSTALRMTNDGACAFSLFRITDTEGVRAGRNSFDAVALVEPPKSGKVQFIATEDATWIEYTPERGFVGEDRFAFRLVPGDGYFPVSVEVSRSIEARPARPNPSSTLVYFEFGRADLTSSARDALEGLRSALADGRYSAWKVDVAGHTDASGAEGLNHRLSERRALAVRDYLVTRMGVSPARITVAGYGKSVLLDKAKPLDGVNRRAHVTFRFGVHTEARPRP